MAIGASFQLTGDKALDAKFKSLAIGLQKKILREALRPAAKEILDEAVRRAPKRSGALAKSLKVKAAKRSRKTKDRVSFNVITAQGWFKGETFYAGFQELGWKRGSRKKAGSRPKVPGREFLRGALKAKGPSARDRAIELIRAGIEREAK